MQTSSPTALLIIDVQTGLFDEKPWNGEQIVARINTLIIHARQTALPIIFVRDSTIVPGSFHPELSVAENDACIEKDYCDAFLKTPLSAQLQNWNIERLIVAGLQTDFCIDTTCRRAASLGYETVLASDAHTTCDHEHLQAEQIVAHHNRILRNFPAGNGRVVTRTCQEIIAGS